MNRRARRALAVALALVAALAILAFLQGPRLLALARAPRAIEVVRTIRDLDEMRPIRLASGATVRVGIEATEAPQGGAVLLYCLSEGSSPPVQGEALGPLSVFVNGRDPSPKNFIQFRNGLTEAITGPKLHVASIPLAETGSLEIELRDSDGSVVGRNTVAVGSERFHAFLPVENDPLIRVLRFDGEHATRFDPGRPLPRFLEPRPSFQLEVSRLDLTVTDDRISNLGDFLARVWINDSPVLKDVDHGWAGIRPLRLNVPPTNRRTFDASPLLRRLGAKPGDRIGIQLARARLVGWPTYSNRVDFVYEP